MPLPFDINPNIIFRAVQKARLCIEDVATGKRPMGMLSGPPGVGKTHECKLGMKKKKCVFHEAHPKDEFSLVSVLWRMQSGLILEGRRKERVRDGLFDDVDSALRNDTTANHLKSGFGPNRKIIFQHQRALQNDDRRDSDDERQRKRYSPLIPPTEFDLTIGLLCLSNLDFNDPSVLQDASEHFKALVSRGLDPITIPDDSENDGMAMFQYTYHLATAENSLRAEQFTWDVARQAIEFYVRNVGMLYDISPRRLHMIAHILRDNPPGAKRDARLASMLAPTNQRPKLKLEPLWIPVLLWPSDPPQRMAPTPQPDPESPEPSPPPSQPVPEPEHGMSQADPVDSVIHDPAVGSSDPDSVRPDPQRDPDPPPAVPVPETPTSQHGDPELETPPSDDHGRDAVDRSKVDSDEPPANPDAVKPEPPVNDDPEPEPPPAASLPQPATEPPETEASPPAAEPVPEPPTEQPGIPPPDCLNLGQAIDAVYRLVRDRVAYHGGDLTCEMVADVLKQFPLAEWDTDDLVALGEQLHYCSAWKEHEALTHAYFQYDHTTKLFASTEAVLTYEGAEHGLQIHSWSSIEQQLAPALAEEQRRAEERQREQRGRDILNARLPKVRKLKAMKALIDEILTCQPTIGEQGQRVIEHIRAMSRDDPQFADCTTFMQYLDKAQEIIEHQRKE